MGLIKTIKNLGKINKFVAVLEEHKDVLKNLVDTIKDFDHQIKIIKDAIRELKSQGQAPVMGVDK